MTCILEEQCCIIDNTIKYRKHNGLLHDTVCTDLFSHSETNRKAGQEGNCYFTVAKFHLRYFQKLVTKMTYQQKESNSKVWKYKWYRNIKLHYVNHFTVLSWSIAYPIVLTAKFASAQFLSINHYPHEKSDNLIFSNINIHFFLEIIYYQITAIALQMEAWIHIKRPEIPFLGF